MLLFRVDPKESSHSRPQLTHPLPVSLAPEPLVGLEEKEGKEPQARRLNLLLAELRCSAALGRGWGHLCRSSRGHLRPPWAQAEALWK